MRFRRYTTFLIAASLVLMCCLVESQAQTRKKKRTRRTPKPAVAKPVITNPAIAPPTVDSTGGVKIISTADETSAESEQVQPQKPKTAATPDSTEQESMQKTITTLSNQVDRLNDKLTQMQETDRYQLDMERLTRAEQRAEQLRSQLIDVQSKLADFESKLEQIEYALKPENIERATATYGTTRPEEARDARKRSLESERSRVQAQIKLVETSKARLEVSVTNADQEVDLLRAKMNQRREQMDAAPAEEPRPRKPDQD